MASYKRILNTYNFTFTQDGDVRGAAGVRQTFNFKMPILPPLPNNESKTGIMRIKSFFIGQQDNVDNVSVSNFQISINGLSIRPTLYQDEEVSNRITIPNYTPHYVNPAGAFDSISNVSGGELSTPYEVICGNPSAQQFSLTIRDEDGDLIAANAGNLNNMTMTFTFEIELIDPDDDQNF